MTQLEMQHDDFPVSASESSIRSDKSTALGLRPRTPMSQRPGFWLHFTTDWETLDMWSYLSELWVTPLYNEDHEDAPKGWP